MTATLTDLSTSHEFFAPIRLWNGDLTDAMVDALADAPRSTPTTTASSPPARMAWPPASVPSSR